MIENNCWGKILHTSLFIIQCTKCSLMVENTRSKLNLLCMHDWKFQYDELENKNKMQKIQANTREKHFIQ